MKEGNIMNDSSKVKAIIICGIIGSLLIGIIWGASQGSFAVFIVGAILGFILGMGLASIPVLSSWLWSKVGWLSILGVVIWFVVMFYGIFIITPIMSIVRLVKSSRNVKEDKEYSMMKEQVEIENTTEDWRDHF